uniref:Uncharacterized protein n=1 Tax=Anguilla anguilla TaxID=7936 RepID=A0A0E9TJE1_ANGAN
MGMGHVASPSWHTCHPSIRGKKPYSIRLFVY